MEARAGISYIAAVPDDEIITGMVTNDNSVFVSTNRRVYILIEDENSDHRLKPIIFDPADI